MNIIEINIEQIRALCLKNNVSSMYVFGSINTQKFTKESDIDLLVELHSPNPIEYSDNYFNLKFELEKLLKRKVDLLERKEMKNPYVLKEIDSTKVLVYERSN